MKNSLRRATIILSFTCALVTPCAHGIVGQPGTLDPFWATGSPLGPGKVITPVGSGVDRANAMTLQPDGKVIVAGVCSNGTNGDFCVARYQANGTLDTSWNGTGKVNTPIGSDGDSANALTLQPDGKVLLAGWCENGGGFAFCAARFLPNGTLDTAWNGTGKVITPIGIQGLASAMTLQPDGKVLVGGRCFTDTNNSFCAARYLTNGTLDPSWGGTGTGATPGIVFTAIGSGGSNAYTMTLQPDDKVLVAGYCGNGANYDFCAARYLANGTLDTTWNGTGKVITSFSDGNDEAYALTLQPDGRVLVAGYCYNGINSDFCAARYLANGTLDTSWNGTGKVITPVNSGGSYARAMTLQPDGKVLLAGNCITGANSDFCVARLLPNGTLDTTWNGTGKVITPVGSESLPTAMTLQTDGKLLVAGRCIGDTNEDFCVARYDGGPFGYQNCKPDLDGDGSFLATTDVLIYARVALGLTGSAVVNGITFPPTATRNTWPLIRDYLVTQCGMSLVP